MEKLKNFLLDGLNRLKSKYGNLKNFIRNVYAYRKFLLKNKNYDYYGYYVFLHNFMNDAIESGYYDDNPKLLKNIKIMAELANRMYNDPQEFKLDIKMICDEVPDERGYFVVKFDTKKLYDLPVSNIFVNGTTKHNKELLHKLLEKHLDKIWD